MSDNSRTPSIFWKFMGFALFFLLWRSVGFSTTAILVVMGTLYLHGYGHILAAKAFGLQTDGVYFIPFLGAVEPIALDKITQHRQMAVVAVAGPVIGGLCALALVGAYAFTGNAAWAGIAGLVAMINAFNLLPLPPLDGGCMMQAMASSVSPRLPILLTAASFAVVVTLFVTGTIGPVSAGILTILWHSAYKHALNSAAADTIHVVMPRSQAALWLATHVTLFFALGALYQWGQARMPLTQAMTAL